MSITWPEFLDELRGRYPSLVAFALEWWHYNAPLLRHVRQIVRPPSRILEVGTGTGALAVLLAAHGYEVVGIDKDPQVITGAKAFAEYFRVPCRFEVADGFDLSAYSNQFDMAFSAGLIEHFPAEEAVRLLQQKAEAAPYVLAVVPTLFALRNDPLTEASGARPISLRELKELFTRANLQVVRRFGYGPPGGTVSRVVRYLLPPAVQWVLGNHLSYAATIGCMGRVRGRNGLPEGRR